ncbi:MAG: hypothetical protein NUW21_07915, partial [Elusimicrobia bacterium]|nr:hypothetical protein [Elusimicrobiota bacterium]
MKTMTRRPSTILSRALLAAFLVGLPGSREAFAQVVGRVGPVAGAGVSASAGASLGGLSSAPGLSASLAPMNLSLSAPAAPGALAPAALRAVPLAAAV